MVDKGNVHVTHKCTLIAFFDIIYLIKILQEVYSSQVDAVQERGGGGDSECKRGEGWLSLFHSLGYLQESSIFVCANCRAAALHFFSILSYRAF